MKLHQYLALLLAPVGSVLAAAEPFTQTALPDIPPEACLVMGETSQADGVLTLIVQSEASPLTPWIHVFFDVSNAEGFQHGSNAPHGEGLDILVEGDILYRFTGTDSSVWGWTPIDGATVERTTAGNTLELRVPIAALGATPDDKVRAFVASYTEDYVTTLDTLPRGAEAWELAVDLASATSATTPAAATVDLLPARADVRDAFRQIASYHCYYGPGHTAELLQRDASIIEVKAQTPAEINALREAGKIAIGYISIGEDDELRIGDGKGPGGYDSGYLDRNEDNQPDKNTTWASYYTNAGSPAWREHFLAKAKAMIESHGVDGFFLDTVETALNYPETFDSMVSLIKDLRAAHPDKVIVLNRGWDLLPDLGQTPDGIMFESFTLSYDFGDKDYVTMRPSAWDHGLEIWQRLLRPAQEEYGLVVLALDYAGSADDPDIALATDRAATLGLIPCFTTINLDAFYNIERKGVRDERWLAMQETAKSRTVTLEEPANGFPAGAVISPSSNYPDYSVAAVVDGVTPGEPKQSLGWRERAWASMEQPGEHFLEIALPQPVSAKKVEINWAWDAGQTFPASNFRVEVQPAGAVGQWATVTHVSDNSSARNEIELPEGEFTGLRIVQASAGGAKLRPNLMWVEQVRLVH